MSNQNLILQSTSIALLSILAASNIPARAIESPTTAKSLPYLHQIAQNKTAQDFNSSGGSKYDAGDNQGALADFNKAIELDPKFASAYNNRGFLKHEKLQDNQGALADFNKAIEIDPKNATAYFNRGSLKNNKLQDYQGTLADYNKAIEIDPKFATAYFNRGILKYQQFKDTPGTIADLRQAAKLARAQGNNDVLQKALDSLKFLGVSE